MREEDFHETGNGFSDCLAVTGVKVSAHREVPVDNLRKIVLAHFAEGLCEIVNNKPVVVREQLVPHLRNLPTGEIEVQTVDERHVVANYVGHRGKEMAGLNHNVDGLIGVAEERNAGVTRDGFLPPLKCAGLAIGLHRRDDFFRHLLEVRNFVETDDIPNLHHALLAASHMTE